MLASGPSANLLFIVLSLSLSLFNFFHNISPGLWKHLLGDEGDVVVAEVYPPEAEAVLKEPVGLVLQLLEPVVA